MCPYTLIASPQEKAEGSLIVEIDKGFVITWEILAKIHADTRNQKNTRKN